MKLIEAGKHYKRSKGNFENRLYDGLTAVGFIVQLRWRSKIFWAATVIAVARYMHTLLSTDFTEIILPLCNYPQHIAE